ncbi:MAG: hypothetical protein ACE1ZD_03230, partial [Dehalococcoidia bacterium]
GADRVHLNIRSHDKQVRLDMPFTVGYCPELQVRLEGLLGPGNVSVTMGKTNGNGNGQNGLAES